MLAALDLRAVHLHEGNPFGLLQQVALENGHTACLSLLYIIIACGQIIMKGLFSFQCSDCLVLPSTQNSSLSWGLPVYSAGCYSVMPCTNAILHTNPNIMLRSVFTLEYVLIIVSTHTEEQLILCVLMMDTILLRQSTKEVWIGKGYVAWNWDTVFLLVWCSGSLTVGLVGAPWGGGVEVLQGNHV